MGLPSTANIVNETHAGDMSSEYLTLEQEHQQEGQGQQELNKQERKVITDKSFQSGTAASKKVLLHFQDKPGLTRMVPLTFHLWIPEFKPRLGCNPSELAWGRWIQDSAVLMILLVRS